MQSCQCGQFTKPEGGILNQIIITKSLHLGTGEMIQWLTTLGALAWA